MKIHRYTIGVCMCVCVFYIYLKRQYIKEDGNLFIDSCKWKATAIYHWHISLNLNWQFTHTPHTHNNTYTTHIHTQIHSSVAYICMYEANLKHMSKLNNVTHDCCPAPTPFPISLPLAHLPPSPAPSSCGLALALAFIWIWCVRLSLVCYIRHVNTTAGNFGNLRQQAHTPSHGEKERERGTQVPLWKVIYKHTSTYIYYMHRLKHKHKHMHKHIHTYTYVRRRAHNACVCVMNIYITKQEVNPIVTRKCDRAIYSICLITSRLASPANLSYSLCLIALLCYFFLCFHGFIFILKLFSSSSLVQTLYLFYLFLLYCA